MRYDSNGFVDIFSRLFYRACVAFRIIVDGYNLIGAGSGLQGNLEQQRDRLVDRVSKYQAQKGFPVTLVFDGWRSGWPEEHGEIRMGVDVVFSRQGEKADAVVVRMARELGKGALVVSSDGEVVRQAQSAGAVVISSQEFESRLNRFLSPGGDPGQAADGEADEEDRPRQKKKGNPRRLSKQERKRRMRLNKL